MRQILQDLKNGDSFIVDAPTPTVSAEHLLINTTTSLISVGTERMLVDFGKANMLDKARQQPDKVKMVLDKVKTDGLLTTIDAVKSKLDQPLPLGYCNVGVVHKAGNGVKGIKEGDRVVSNGAHADVVRVPKNLCAKIPDSVSDEEAAFTVIASIGLQGVRLAKPTLGECFVVTGVGLIGLLTVQLLRAHGCRVLAVDFDTEKLELAKSFGAQICNLSKGEDPVAAGLAFSRGVGVDGVLITASTKSSAPVSDAAKMSRKRGRIVLVGVTGLQLSRSDFYEKELSFQVSCSYGPGRYDPDYEGRGNDYPLGFVRWTEQRNFEAILDMLASGQLDVTQLISKRFKFENASEAYAMLSEDKSALGILLEYTSKHDERHASIVPLYSTSVPVSGEPVVGFLGAGNYAARVLIPAFKKAGAQLHTISTSSGVTGVTAGGRAGFLQATTDSAAVIEDNAVNTVAIVTRHDSHATFVIDALTAGKNVFVEKPLALNLKELDEIESAYEKAAIKDYAPSLMVGFNRRFSPHVEKMKELLSTISEPKSFIMTMNAGAIPAEHWTQNIHVGGGRIVGEACHFIDLMRYLANSKIVSVQARRMGENSAVDIVEDKAAIILGFADGSFGTIHYFANGAASFPKERVEVFAAGRVLQLDNFRKLKAFGWPNFKKMNLWQQDKGQHACVTAFLDSIKMGKPAPIPVAEIFEIARVSINVAHALRQQE
ncbi:bi-domain-containing oxidoreductase [Halodesulfovibrio aestuarii]|uniref:Bi-domain-containing oxidoreductase n=1 Tax=Halodesulfovibrio aestuarii TaxID=126333 RepID=A0ABV4JU07_9BACT